MAVEKKASLGPEKTFLLIGDIHKAFCDTSMDGELVTISTLAEAIGAAVLKHCAAIAIVISGNIVRLKSGIKAIRNTYHSRIILLAQMYEEPIAIRLVGSEYNGMPLADDYMICPVRPENFYESMLHTKKSGSEVRSAYEGIDPSIETRIRQLEKLATEDDLTSLKNRRYIWEFSRQIIEQAKDEDKRVTLLVFDIDDLKHYNDLYGHTAGDEILKQVGALMRRCCRSHDVVGRIGGDEFAVVFWDDPSNLPDQELKSNIKGTAKNERRLATADHPNEAISIARRFVRELESAPASIGELSGSGLGPDGKGVLTISGGLASFPRDGSTVQELFLKADKALLEAKRSGKNRIYLVGSPQSEASTVSSRSI